MHARTALVSALDTRAAQMMRACWADMEKGGMVPDDGDPDPCGAAWAPAWGVAALYVRVAPARRAPHTSPRAPTLVEECAAVSPSAPHAGGGHT